MFKLGCDISRSFETLDQALEAAEGEELDTVVLDYVEDVVARYRPGSGVEWPVGAFMLERSKQVARKKA